MTIFYIILAAIPVSLILIVLIGSMMPERYEGSSAVTYAKPAEAVWTALMDYDRHPMTGKWKKDIGEESVTDGLPAWSESMGHGEKILVTTTELDKPKKLSRSMASASVPMTSVWSYQLESVTGGSKLTMHGVTFIRKGTWHVPIFRVMMKLGGGVKKGLDIQMDMLAETLGVPAQR